MHSITPIPSAYELTLADALLDSNDYRALAHVDKLMRATSSWFE